MALSILLARALVDLVEDANVSRRDFLDAAGFDAARLDAIEGRMELAEYDALIEHALEITGDPTLGLHLAVAARASTYNLTAHLVEHATTLRQALDTLDRYHRLMTDRRVWRLEEDRRTATLRFEFAAGSLRCRRFRAESGLTGFYRMVRYFVRDARVESVSFEYPPPPYAEQYTSIFDGVERFDQSFTGLVIDRALMDVTHMNRDEEIHAALQINAAKRIARLEHRLTYADKVKEVVSGAPARRDMDSVARALGMSSRSLRRRLAEEGAVYQVLIDDALASLATRKLLDERWSIQELAEQLCYSDVSSFSRAFKRWTGSTPKQYQSTRGAS